LFTIIGASNQQEVPGKTQHLPTLDTLMWDVLFSASPISASPTL